MAASALPRVPKTACDFSRLAAAPRHFPTRPVRHGHDRRHVRSARRAPRRARHVHEARGAAERARSRDLDARSVITLSAGCGARPGGAVGGRRRRRHGPVRRRRGAGHRLPRHVAHLLLAHPLVSLSAAVPELCVSGRALFLRPGRFVPADAVGGRRGAAAGAARGPGRRRVDGAGHHDQAVAALLRAAGPADAAGRRPRCSWGFSWRGSSRHGSSGSNYLYIYRYNQALKGGGSGRPGRWTRAGRGVRRAARADRPARPVRSARTGLAGASCRSRCSSRSR